MKRLSFQVIGDYEQITAIPLGLTYNVYRFDNGKLRSREDMAIEFYAYFESKILLSEGRMSDCKRNHRIIMAEMMLELKKMKNAISIPPLFNFTRYPGEGKLPNIPVQVAEFFRLWDFRHLRRVLGLNCDYQWFKDYVFKKHFRGLHDGLEWNDCSGSLVMLCLRKLSSFNKMFTGDHLGRYVVHTTENLYPHKLVTLLNKYDKPTRDPKVKTRYFARILARGMETMYEYMDVKKFFGKLVWVFSEDDIIGMNLVYGSSSGLRSGGSHEYKKDGIKYVVTTNGTKEDQEYPIKKRLLHYIREFARTGKFKFYEKACCICLKQEIIFSDSSNEETRKNIYDKCRNFSL